MSLPPEDRDYHARRVAHETVMINMKRMLTDHLGENPWRFLLEDVIETVTYPDADAEAARNFIRLYTATNTQVSIVRAVDFIGNLGPVSSASLSNWLNTNPPSPTMMARIMRFLWLVWRTKDVSRSARQEFTSNSADGNLSSLVQNLSITENETSEPKKRPDSLKVQTNDLAAVGNSPTGLTVLTWTMDIDLDLRGNHLNEILQATFRVLTGNDVDLMLLRGGLLDPRFWTIDFLRKLGLAGYGVIRSTAPDEDNDHVAGRLFILYRSNRFESPEVVGPSNESPEISANSIMISMYDNVLRKRILIGNLYLQMPEFETAGLIWPSLIQRENYEVIISHSMIGRGTKSQRLIQGITLTNSELASYFNDGPQLLGFHYSPIIWMLGNQAEGVSPMPSPREPIVPNFSFLSNREVRLASRLDPWHSSSMQFLVTSFNLKHGRLPGSPHDNIRGYPAVSRALFRAALRSYPSDVQFLQETLALNLDNELVDLMRTYVNHNHLETAIFVDGEATAGRNLSSSSTPNRDGTYPSPDESCDYNLEIHLNAVERELMHNTRRNQNPNNWILDRTSASRLFMNGYKIIVVSFHGHARETVLQRIARMRQLFDLLQTIASYESAPILLGGDFNIDFGEGVGTDGIATKIDEFWRNLPRGWSFAWSNILEVPSFSALNSSVIDYIMAFNPPGLNYYLDFFNPGRVEVLNRAAANGFGPALERVDIENIIHMGINENLPNRVSWVWDHTPIEAVVRIHVRQPSKEPAVATPSDKPRKDISRDDPKGKGPRNN
jgi:hypothetical protein